MRFFRATALVLSGAAIALAGSVLAQVTIPQPTRTITAFPDVQSSTFYAPSVSTLMRAGVLQGYQNGSFGPDDPVTRAQVSVMIDRYDQNVIQPLRVQLNELRTKLGMGTCGDGIVQSGEECDDGNVIGGDGCSANCLKEKEFPRCIDGKNYPAPDGCNVCVCQNGRLACTQMGCPVPVPGCGNGKCDPGEAGVCTTTCSANDNTSCTTNCSIGTCPGDCSQHGGTPTVLPQPIGGQKDAYGCFISAGYSWCDAKQKCIRPWEEPCSPSSSASSVYFQCPPGSNWNGTQCSGIDAHGCVPDGGYSWCASKNKCLRPWEEACPTLSSSASSVYPQCPPGSNWNGTQCSSTDPHGCVPDGGYLWCASKNKCIRPWEEPCN